MSEEGAEGQLRRRQEIPQPRPPAARESGRVVASSNYASTQDNYWAYMFGVVFFLFVAYVAGKNQLGDWLEVLIPAPAKAPKFVGAGQEPGGTDTGGAGTSQTPLDKLAPNVPGAAPPGQRYGEPGYGIGGEVGRSVMDNIKKYLGY